MARSAKSPKVPAPAAPSTTLAALRPLPAPRGLAHELIARLTADITGGKLAPGTRLPTEQDMIATTGVSRTVVREAVAALRAEGLVVTRQGVGAFVAAQTRRPFRIEGGDIEGGDLETLRDVITIMELRTGVEVEAAGIAAERASAASLRRIEEAYGALAEAIARGGSGVDQDYAFHRSIAEATDNPQFVRFVRFLEYLGRFIIPRQTVRAADAPAARRAYLTRIQNEHAEILGALRTGAAQTARAAMRRHLVNSRKRYERLAAAMSEG
jgi:GntR family transcriptional repressor for pyruvate dehydrogenase complex